MGTLYLRKETKKYHCGYVDAEGRRVSRSTGYKDRKSAMEQLVKWEKEELAKKKASHEGQKSILAVLQRAGEMASSGKLNMEAARACLNEMMEISTGEALASYTIRGWLEEWLAGRGGTASEATLAAYKTAVKHFLAKLGTAADQPLTNLRETHLRTFRDAQLATGKAARTANQSIKILGLALRDAQRQGLIPRNPAEVLKILREQDSTEREPFSIEEVQTLLGAAGQEWQGMILLGFYGGLRLEDAAGLRWSSIDLQEGKLTFVPKKTAARKKHPQVIPIHPALMDFLITLPSGEKPDSPLFQNLHTKQSGGRYGLSRTFIELMEKAGVDTSTNNRREGKDKTLARRVHRKSFHSLRHSHISNLANAGVSAEIRMKLAGHSSGEIHQIYSHLEWDQLDKAVDLLPDLLKKSPTPEQRS